MRLCRSLLCNERGRVAVAANGGLVVGHDRRHPGRTVTASGDLCFASTSTVKTITHLIDNDQMEISSCRGGQNCSVQRSPTRRRYGCTPKRGFPLVSGLQTGRAWARRNWHRQSVRPNVNARPDGDGQRCKPAEPPTSLEPFGGCQLLCPKPLCGCPVLIGSGDAGVLDNHRRDTGTPTEH